MTRFRYWKLVAEEVEKRDVQNKNASQLYWDSMFPQVLKSGRSDQALKLDKTVYDCKCFFVNSRLRSMRVVNK